jgi:hypothetical protein
MMGQNAGEKFAKMSPINNVYSSYFRINRVNLKSLEPLKCFTELLIRKNDPPVEKKKKEVSRSPSRADIYTVPDQPRYSRRNSYSQVNHMFRARILR